MSRAETVGNMVYEPILPIQNASSSGTQIEARAFSGNLVEPFAELAATDLPANGLQFLRQREQSHCLPAVSQENAMLLQLAASHQMLLHQQTLTESLIEQLVSSRERIAQMERNLALLQQSYDEQQHLLKDAEASCQDLRARLHRQQHQTLQFKAALEKCSDSTLWNEPLDQRYQPTVPQPSRQPPTGCGPLQKIGSGPVESLAAINSLLGCGSHSIDISTSSPDTTHQPVVQHHVASGTKHRVSPEEAAYSQEIAYSVDRPAHPSLTFRGQPVQPWSASQAFPTNESTRQEQATTQAATSTIWTVEVEPKPSQKIPTPTHSTRSSPLLEPLQPASRRRSPARIELPTFSRRQ